MITITSYDSFKVFFLDCRIGLQKFCNKVQIKYFKYNLLMSYWSWCYIILEIIGHQKNFLIFVKCYSFYILQSILVLEMRDLEISSLMLWNVIMMYRVSSIFKCLRCLVYTTCSLWFFSYCEPSAVLNNVKEQQCSKRLLKIFEKI